MKEKDIKLFNKTIHEVKNLMIELGEERDLYHRVVNKLTKRHDKKINKMLKEAKDIVDELYELFDDLTETGEK